MNDSEYLIFTSARVSIGMKRLNKYTKLTAIICLLLLGIIQLTTPTAATENIGGDPFKDPLQWETYTHGDAQVTSDPGLTITSSPNYEYSGAEVFTTWQFIGDFDVQVDYSGVE